MFPFRCLNLYYSIQDMKKGAILAPMNSYIYLTSPAGANVLPGLIMAGVLEVFLVVLSRPKKILVVHRPYLLPQEVGRSRKKL